MTRALIGAIDQGTTSTRFIVFDAAGAVVSMARREHAQITRQPGWVEHDAEEIFLHVRETAAEALIRADLTPRDLAAVGITNQRETTVLWDRATGVPLAPAIVWQDTRTDGAVAELAREGGPDRLRALTGLPLASYFSALKLRWLLQHVPGARSRAAAGEALFGTIDSWIAWRLTGRHVTDVTNASRTQLFDIATLDWSWALLALFDIPRACLPAVVCSSEVIGPAGYELGGVPVAGLIGDQQAALVGQGCLAPGAAKNTYGTGNFLLLHTGDVPVVSQAGLITTVAYRFGADPPAYALEGSIAVTGALIQWLRDQLGLIGSGEELDRLAASVPDSGGAYIVPAFSGLYAPYWRPEARGVIAGLTRFVGRAHLCRAALEAAAYQTFDVVQAMRADAGLGLTELRVDGGLAASGPLLQFQADLLDAVVVRPAMLETTALGAAYVAGLAAGRPPCPRREAATRFTPAMDEVARERRLAGWRDAVRRTLLEG